MKARLGSFSRSFLCLTGAGFLIISTECALGIDPPPAVSPAPGAVEVYMITKGVQAATIIPQTATSMPSTTSVTRHQFYQGNFFLMVLAKHTYDFLFEHLNILQPFTWWWDCTETQWEGICYDCDWGGCSFANYHSYYYPVQNFELSSQVFVSEYLPKEFFLLLPPMFQDLSGYWYDVAEQQTPDEMDRVAAEIGGSASPPTYSPNFAGGINNTRMANTAEQMEWRIVSTLAQHMYVQNNPIYPLLFARACHHIKETIPWPMPSYSESPLHIEFTRLGDMLDFFFLPFMLYYKQLLGGEIPTWGVGTNLTNGWAPTSLLAQNFPSVTGNFAAPIPNLTLATPHLGTDYGGTHQSGGEYSKKWVGQMLRAAHFGPLVPGTFFPFHKYSGGRKRSRFQWLSPGHMPDGCKERIPQNPTEDYGSFLHTDYHPEVDRDDQGRGTITEWRWFRCCPPGMSVWFGPGTQYKN